MLQSFWEFLRIRACDAVLAGVEDAVRFLEQDASPTDRVDAATHLATRLQKVVAQHAQPGASSGPAEKSPQKPQSPSKPGPKPDSPADPVSDARETQPVPSLTASPAGHLKKSPKSPFSNRRSGKRGRPQESQA